MKYSFMTPLFPERNLEELLDTARRHGVDAIELRLENGNHGVDISNTNDERVKIRKTIDESDIAISCVATSCRYANDLENQIEKTKASIDLAYDIGAPVIRVFGTNAGDFGPCEPFDNVDYALKAVADYAEEKGIYVLIETHDSWYNAYDVKRVMEAVDKPYIAVNWDVAHSVRDGKLSVAETYEVLKPWIRHTHAHDFFNPEEPEEKIWKIIPIGSDECDFRLVIKLLKEGGYDGYLGGEWHCNTENEDPETFLKQELATLKGYEQDLMN